MNPIKHIKFTMKLEKQFKVYTLIVFENDNNIARFCLLNSGLAMI